MAPPEMVKNIGYPGIFYRYILQRILLLNIMISVFLLQDQSVQSGQSERDDPDPGTR